jgi:hypothetical protein
MRLLWFGVVSSTAFHPFRIILSVELDHGGACSRCGWSIHGDPSSLGFFPMLLHLLIDFHVRFFTTHGLLFLPHSGQLFVTKPAY